MKTRKNNKSMGTMTAIVVVITFLSSCTGYHHLPKVTSGNLLVDEQRQEKRYENLTEVLKQLPHLRVVGHYSSASVIVTRNTQLGASQPPLFVVDGMETGYYYSQVYNMVKPEEIKRIQVLNDAEALSIYGQRGKNGAVVIRTNRDS